MYNAMLFSQVMFSTSEFCFAWLRLHGPFTEELDLLIFVGPLQVRKFYDSVI